MYEGLQKQPSVIGVLNPMIKAAGIFALALAICLLAGCYSARLYEGDGVLEDKGFLSMYGRYELKLGEISLSESGNYIFRAARMPKEEFAAGFGIQSLPNHKKYASVFVHLQVYNEKQQVVVDETGPLSGWVWEHALNGNESFLRALATQLDV